LHALGRRLKPRRWSLLLAAPQRRRKGRLCRRGTPHRSDFNRHRKMMYHIAAAGEKRIFEMQKNATV
jgi:hypothetical protein